MHRKFLVAMACLACLALSWLLPFAVLTEPATAQDPASAGEGREAILERFRAAQREARKTEMRAEKLEREAQLATQALDKTARASAALAARVQQAEAGIDAAQARLALIDRQRGQLMFRLEKRREPLTRLTGALQLLARRPLALSALKSGSLRDTVYLRAMLESAVPDVRARTASLRGEIVRAQALEREAQQALRVLRDAESTLETRQQRLAVVETRQRLAQRQAGGAAYRERDRALALAEEARDLDMLVAQVGKTATLRRKLAALPGPALRPARPEHAATATVGPAAHDSTANAPDTVHIQMPVSGRIAAGFGAGDDRNIRSSGLAIVPRKGAQVVAPAAGRVAFAGPYRGYARIVIIEHADGWTSLVTGLARCDVAVGDRLVRGAPLGVAGVHDPRITLELRRDGNPVNPIEYVR